MKLVVIESPFRASTQALFVAHILYARACVRDSLLRGEAPFAPHLLYTQDGILRDDVPAERKHGIAAGHTLYETVTAYPEPGCIMGRPICAVYVDFGVSDGMKAGIQAAKVADCEIVHRSLRTEEKPDFDVAATFRAQAERLLKDVRAGVSGGAILLSFRGEVRP